MTKADTYRTALRALPQDQWDGYLRAESNLPGPRANLELLHVAADEGEEVLFRRYVTYTPDLAPVNSPDAFLACCGVVGLGRLLAAGRRDILPELRALASDPRWRVREAVAMALQRFGAVDMPALLDAMQSWAGGSPYEQRAAAAALCEPALLANPDQVEEVLRLLDRITASLPDVTDRKYEAFDALVKGLSYCWSVAVAALPEAGKPLMERWFASDDPAIQRIMKDNLRKKRLERADATWTQRWKAHFAIR